MERQPGLTQAQIADIIVQAFEVAGGKTPIATDALAQAVADDASQYELGIEDARSLFSQMKDRLGSEEPDPVLVQLILDKTAARYKTLYGEETSHRPMDMKTLVRAVMRPLIRRF